MIRKAQETDALQLTHIAFSSKKHWDYPDHYFDIWRDELTITKDYITNNIVFVHEQNGAINGFYSLCENKKDQYFGKVFVEKGWWLDHIFILPEYIKQGIGKKLIAHMKQTCREQSITHIKIFSDPYSRGFYEKIGARFVRESDSSIEGRKIPVFELTIVKKGDKKFAPANMSKLDSDKRRKMTPPAMILDLLTLQEGDTFLDIGAGIGYFAIPALDYVGKTGKVIATDISQDMLDELKRRLPDDTTTMNFIIADAESIPLADAAADLILLAFVFHEVDDQIRCLQEMTRLLKKGGKLAIAEWDTVPSPPGPPSHERISVEQLTNLGKQARLQTTFTKKINEYQYLAILQY